MKKLFFNLTLSMILLVTFGCQPENNNTEEQISDTFGVENTSTEEETIISEEKLVAEESEDFLDLSYIPTDSDLRSANEMTPAPPYTGAFDKFPHSTELPNGAKSVKLNDGYNNNIEVDEVTVLNDIVYDNRDGEELVLQILLPPGENNSPTPLIIYIPGSAWARQNVYIALPAMTRVAAQGFAVAVVEYRGTDVAYFPAQTEDAKAAVRFMRMNSEKYNINTEKVAIWGDSSGGHTALMAGLTGDREFINDTYSNYSSEVNCIIDWYGPTDISIMSYYESIIDHVSPESPEGKLIGGLNVIENSELAQKANPINYITAEVDIPPILIMHGSRDSLVPFNQSVRLYEKLRETEKQVEMYKVEDGTHGYGGFAGDEALNLVLEFIGKWI